MAVGGTILWVFFFPFKPWGWDKALHIHQDSDCISFLSCFSVNGFFRMSQFILGWQLLVKSSLIFVFHNWSSPLVNFFFFFFDLAGKSSSQSWACNFLCSRSIQEKKNQLKCMMIYLCVPKILEWQSGYLPR